MSDLIVSLNILLTFVYMVVVKPLMSKYWLIDAKPWNKADKEEEISYLSLFSVYLTWERKTPPKKKSHSHTSVCFHNARLIREDLPNKPTESDIGYTQKGGTYMIETSRTSVWYEIPVSGVVYRWRGAGIGLKLGGCNGSRCPVECKSSRALRVSHGTAKLKGWEVRALSPYSP